MVSYNILLKGFDNKIYTDFLNFINNSKLEYIIRAFKIRFDHSWSWTTKNGSCQVNSCYIKLNDIIFIQVK